ncbi:MAG: glutamate racemase [Bacteroidota bacterium]
MNKAIQYPIGVFDSGYGGLTILNELCNELPEYDYIYLGDNARAPYGNRSFETVYTYTLQCVKKLFEMGCPLVILACNTASSKALRTIQQSDLPKLYPDRRVLGVIRPTTEIIGNFSKSGEIGILATEGTISSDSYPIEIKKFFPSVKVHQEACPMWVSLVENNEQDSDGADYFVKQHLQNLFKRSDKIDTILLGCTHFPLLIRKIKKYVPEEIKIISQGKIVAQSLKNYLSRHPEIEKNLKKENLRFFFTTENNETFNQNSKLFLGNKTDSIKITIS